MMEAASTSETSVNFYKTTRRNNTEGSHLHICKRVNLTTHQPFEAEDRPIQSLPQRKHSTSPLRR
jgi:hypothetical protein